jgi:hypothetical protein
MGAESKRAKFAGAVEIKFPKPDIKQNDSSIYDTHATRYVMRAPDGTLLAGQPRKGKT